MTRLSKRGEQALLQRLLANSSEPAVKNQHAPETHRSHGERRKKQTLTTGRVAPATARRHCVECGAVVGKGRKALTCAACDLVAALRTHGADLPPPEREVRFHATRKWRFDLCWRSALVAVEADGGQFVAKGGRHNTDADREKLNEAAAGGWRILRFSPQQIAADPVACVALVRRALERSA